MEIAKSQNDAVPSPLIGLDDRRFQKLTKQEISFVSASLGTKIREYEQPDLAKQLLSTFSACYSIAGFTPPDMQTMVAYSVEFAAQVQQVYPKATLEEVKEALRRGVYGEYGDFHGINPRTAFGFLKSYLWHETRRAALEAYQNAQVEPPAEPTEAEKQQIKREFIEGLYQLHRAGKLPVEMVTETAYNTLVKDGLLRLTNEQKLEYLRRAEAHMKAKAAIAPKGMKLMLDYLSTNHGQFDLKCTAKALAVIDLLGTIQTKTFYNHPNEESN